jgi:hypothetical protein
VALLQPEFPSHDVFADPLFQTPEYRKFKKDVTVAAEAGNREDRRLGRIEECMPMVGEHLRTMAGAIQTGLEGNDRSIRHMQEMVDVRLGTIENTLNRICDGSFTFTPGSSRRAQGSQPSCSLPLRLPTAAPSSGPMPAPTAIESLAEQPPMYHMSRGITTIPELWSEWTVGRGGQLSVEALDERWGSHWRHGAEFQFYSRRKVIIDEIKRLLAGGREAMHVVDSLEEQRNKSKASLSQVINRLKAEAKARNGGT